MPATCCDLADNPQHAGKQAKMEALLLSEMRQAGDPWRLWNQPGDGLSTPVSGKPKRKRGKSQS